MHASTLTQFDHGRLSALALAVRKSAKPERARYLDARLKSVVVLEDSAQDDRVVRLDSTVAFTELENGRSFEYRVVLPSEADIARGRVSVLTPLGAALLGRRQGERFCYDSPGGRVEVRLELVSREG